MQQELVLQTLLLCGNSYSYMSLIIAIGNYIGINQLGITPPYGGEDIVTETGVQMVSETGSQDLITEQAP